MITQECSENPVEKMLEYDMGELCISQKVIVIVWGLNLNSRK